MQQWKLLKGFYLPWTYQKALVWTKYPWNFWQMTQTFEHIILCNLVNLSIKQSLFPDQLKIVITVVPKIIEKTICIETQEYLDKNGLLYKYQSGFLPKFSTDSCATYRFYFERNGHRISHWDDPSWPTKSVWHVRLPRTFTKNVMCWF